MKKGGAYSSFGRLGSPFGRPIHHKSSDRRRYAANNLITNYANREDCPQTIKINNPLTNHFLLNNL